MRLNRRAFSIGAASALAALVPGGKPALGRATEDTVRATAAPAHGLSLFGNLKYGPDFVHFDYVEPDASKGGELHLATVGSFSTLNPYSPKGVSASRMGLHFESLLQRSADEPASAYGLIAQGVALAPDRRSVRFLLRPEARMHDGAPITAADVVFSLEILRTEGRPSWVSSLGGVDRVETAGAHDVTFHLADRNRKLPLILGDMPILSEAYYSGRSFRATTMEPPLGSGPYRVASVDAGRAISYERVTDHWSTALPVNVGRHNFDRITVDYFRDRTVMVEALKKGAFDLHEEHTARVWMKDYDIPAVREGWLVKEVLPDNRPSGLQGFFFNSRLAKFRDLRVRQALSHVFDFEWANKTLFFGLYERTRSYFENSELAARRLPSEAEMVICLRRVVQVEC